MDISSVAAWGSSEVRAWLSSKNRLRKYLLAPAFSQDSGLTGADLLKLRRSQIVGNASFQPPGAITKLPVPLLAAIRGLQEAYGPCGGKFAPGDSVPDIDGSGTLAVVDRLLGAGAFGEVSCALPPC